MLRQLPYAIAIMVVSACSQPPSEQPIGCLDDTPDAYGQACIGDGECGSWLVCSDESCTIPPTVSGDAGLRATLTGGDEELELMVERARSDLARTRGLGNRPCHQDGWAMLIEFPRPDDHLIETATMRYDLDVAMLGEDGVIHTVHPSVPAGSKALLGAEQPVSSVLEAPAGALPFSVGQRLTLEQ